jgi:YfiH family protein
MIIRPTIFDQFPEIIAAQSTRLGGVSPEPFGMNLSSHVGDEQANVDENRRRFFATLGIPPESKAVYQNQVHSANINLVRGEEGVVKESDALITAEPGVLLGVTVADCTPILLYDPRTRHIAAVHAGWRGTEQMIALATVRRLIELGSNPIDLYAFIGASASKENYEVGVEVATLFESRHSTELPSEITHDLGKYLLDVKGANYEQLLFAGIPAEHIELSPLCTIGDERLHSYRRDGKRSGRMPAAIMRRTLPEA